jgi:hypothetical protein
VRHPVFDGGDYPSGNGRPVRLLPDRLVPLIAPLEAQGRIERRVAEAGVEQNQRGEAARVSGGEMTADVTAPRVPSESDSVEL